MYKQKRCKLRKNQTLCRPNRAAFLPPLNPPTGGDETSLIFTDYRQAKIFRLIVGRIAWFVLVYVITPRLVAFLATGLRLIARLGE